LESTPHRGTYALKEEEDSKPKSGKVRSAEKKEGTRWREKNCARPKPGVKKAVSQGKLNYQKGLGGPVIGGADSGVKTGKGPDLLPGPESGGDGGGGFCSLVKPLKEEEETPSG